MGSGVMRPLLPLREPPPWSPLLLPRRWPFSFSFVVSTPGLKTLRQGLLAGLPPAMLAMLGMSSGIRGGTRLVLETMAGPGPSPPRGVRVRCMAGPAPAVSRGSIWRGLRGEDTEAARVYWSGGGKSLRLRLGG